MSKPEFKVYFRYETMTTTHPQVAKRKITITTCVIENASKQIVAEATVIPHYSTVENRLLARKFAFEKALHIHDVPTEEISELNGETVVVISHYFTRAQRTELWKTFRANNTQPELGRVRLRHVKFMINAIKGLDAKTRESIVITLTEALDFEEIKERPKLRLMNSSCNTKDTKQIADWKEKVEHVS